MKNVDRFDFTKQERDMMNRAVEIGILDAVELGCFMATNGANVRAIFSEIMDCAYSDIHCDPSKHAEWCEMMSEYSRQGR